MATPPDAPAVLDEPVPAPTPDQLASLITENFGAFTATSPLPGEVDRNYRVETTAGSRMLKISRPGPNADMQTAIAEHLSPQQGVPVPRLIRTLDDESTARVVLEEDHVVARMTTFIDGQSPRKVILRDLFYPSFGAELARLDRALAEISTDITQPDHPWHIGNVGAVAQRLLSGPSFPERSYWVDLLTACDVDVLPQLATLPVQVIHNDLNPENVLVTSEGSSVKAFVDFGDAVASARIVDLAIAAAYFVVPLTPTSLLTTLSGLVRGYHHVSPLSAEEIALISPLLQARWAMALSMNHLRAAEQPDDATYVAYVQRNSPRSAARLHAFSQLPSAAITAALASATA